MVKVWLCLCCKCFVCVTRAAKMGKVLIFVSVVYVSEVYFVVGFLIF